MSSAHESDALAFLRLGNRVAKEHALEILGRRKLSVFHTLLDKPHLIHELLAIKDIHEQRRRAKELGIPKSRIHRIKEILEIPPHDRALCRTYITVAPELFKKHERMILRISRDCFNNWFGVKQIHDRYNFRQVASVGLQQAIRGYTDGSIAFCTYAWHCIRRAVLREITTLTGLTGSATQLFREFQRAKEKLTVAGSPCDFDSIIAFMRENGSSLDSDDVKSIKCSLLEETFQYESAGDQPLSRLVADTRKDTAISYDVIEALREASAGLSQFELDAFKAHPLVRGLFQGHTLAAVGRLHHKSSQAANYALDRAIQRLRAILGAKLGEKVRQRA